MIRLLLLAFIIVPIVELAVIIRVGGILGFWETFALIVVIGIVGAILWKQEGRRTWDAFRDALAEGRWPGDEVTQGALVLFGGALLLTPGFITDVVGLLSVLPPSRAAISRLIRRRVTPGPVREVFRMRDASSRRSRTREDSRTRDRGTIDVEVVSVERDEPRRTVENERGRGAADREIRGGNDDAGLRSAEVEGDGPGGSARGEGDASGGSVEDEGDASGGSGRPPPAPPHDAV